LGRSVTKHKEVSDETAHLIDEEIRALIDRNYKRSETILEENRDKLDMMADALIRYETIDENQIKDIMNGRAPQPPEDWSDSDDDGGVDKPIPVETSSTEKGSDPSVGGPANQH